MLLALSYVCGAFRNVCSGPLNSPRSRVTTVFLGDLIGPPSELSSLPPATGASLLPPSTALLPTSACHSSLNRPVSSEDSGLQALSASLASGILLLHVAPWGASLQPFVPQGEIQKRLVSQARPTRCIWEAAARPTRHNLRL